MADNTPFQATPATLPAGFAPATDDIGGVAFQRVKLTLGADGVNDGDVSSANPIPASIASLPLPSGAATSANQSTELTRLGDLTETAPATDTASSGLNGRLQRIAQRLTSLIALLPASLGQKLMAASLPVVLASDQAAIPVTVTSTTVTGTVTTKETRASTSAVTSVNDTASSTTLLAANANRLGATVYNDSTVDLYLKLGATASLTSFTVKMIPGAYYEIPFAYTGIVDGIWASDAAGAARIAELT